MNTHARVWAAVSPWACGDNESRRRHLCTHAHRKPSDGITMHAPMVTGVAAQFCTSIHIHTYVQSAHARLCTRSTLRRVHKQRHRTSSQRADGRTDGVTTRMTRIKMWQFVNALLKAALSAPVTGESPVQRTPVNQIQRLRFRLLTLFSCWFNEICGKVRNG